MLSQRVSQRMCFRFALLLPLLTFLSAAMQGQKTDDVFLIGDSISLYYTPFLKKDFGEHLRFARKNEPETNPNMDIPSGSNGGTSKMVLDYLKVKYADPAFHPHILLVNAGLHDIKRDPKTNVIAITPEIYEQDLLAIEEISRKHGSRLIWINTTPVDDARHNRLSKAFFRYNADVLKCNQIAEQVLGAKGVPVIDLYSFTLNNDAGAHYIDHVHYDDAMRALQAAYISGAVLALTRLH